MYLRRSGQTKAQKPLNLKWYGAGDLLSVLRTLEDKLFLFHETAHYLPYQKSMIQVSPSFNREDFHGRGLANTAGTPVFGRFPNLAICQDMGLWPQRPSGIAAHRPIDPFVCRHCPVVGMGPPGSSTAIKGTNIRVSRQVL